MTETDIATAVALLRTSPDLDDEALFAQLLGKGVERRTAARLIEFLPMAYTRIAIGNSGVRFPETFDRRLQDGTTQQYSFSSEPIWLAALAYARSEAENGASRNELLAIAARSAEFDAIQQLLTSGSKLQHILLTPALLWWPETGPPVGPTYFEPPPKTSPPRSYGWGIFQAWFTLLQGIGTFAYNYPFWRKIMSWVAALLCFVVWWGLRRKRRSGLIFFYVLGAFAYANLAWGIGRSFFRHHQDWAWLLHNPFYFYLVAWTTLLYLIPAAFYYPKRWQEFSRY
jgi:hypothetical protein